MAALLAIVIIVSIINPNLAQYETRNREYPLKKEILTNYQTVNGNVFPGGENINTHGAYETKTSGTVRGRDGKLSEVQSKFSERNEAQFTVHGANDVMDHMSSDERSMHGCMTIMKKANDARYEKMSDEMMTSSCEMYRKWGTNMAQEKTWLPTDGQKAWLNSLGVKEQMDKMHAPHARRLARQSGSGGAIRKEIRMLTDQERRDMHESIRTLKNSFMDGMSKYDLFVNFHQANQAPSAHFGPGFLGYHRELLFRQNPSRGPFSWFGPGHPRFDHIPRFPVDYQAPNWQPFNLEDFKAF